MVATSSGGHWVQMRRILPAFDNCALCFVGTERALDTDLPSAPYYRVHDVNRLNPLGFFRTFVQVSRAVRAERPDVIVTTGAAPGLVALVAGKMLVRAQTIWIDSIANTRKLSLSGRLARPIADAWLVQWPHLAREGGPKYWGAVV